MSPDTVEVLDTLRFGDRSPGDERIYWEACSRAAQMMDDGYVPAAVVAAMASMIAELRARVAVLESAAAEVAR